MNLFTFTPHFGDEQACRFGFKQERYKQVVVSLQEMSR